MSPLHRFKSVLEALLCKDASVVWSKQATDSFRAIQEILSGDVLLAKYDPRQTLIVAAEACGTGIGGVLLRRYLDGTAKAVFHVAEALTPVQRSCSQIVKEAMALSTILESRRKFVRGHKFVLRSDHMPLVVLFQPGRGLSVRTAARLRRWALRLIGFDSEIEFVRLTEVGHTDALSRLNTHLEEKAADPGIVEVIASIEVTERGIVCDTLDLMPPSTRRKELCVATGRDPVLSVVLKRLKDGWQASHV